MSAQTTYGFATPRGVAGGLVDLSNYDIVTRLNEASDGAMKFGVGVVHGTSAGSQVKLPVAGSTAAVFEGVVVNSHSAEMDMSGDVSLKKNVSVGVLRYGKVWVRVPSAVAPAYGDNVYLIVSGDDTGSFTKTAGSNTVAINARFIGGKGTSGAVAPAEFYNQSNVPGTLAGLSDVDVSTPPTNGQALKYSTTDSKWKPTT